MQPLWARLNATSFPTDSRKGTLVKEDRGGRWADCLKLSKARPEARQTGQTRAPSQEDSGNKRDPNEGNPLQVHQGWIQTLWGFRTF